MRYNPLKRMTPATAGLLAALAFASVGLLLGWSLPIAILIGLVWGIATVMGVALIRIWQANGER